MKKTILALLMLGSGAVAWSQDSLNTDYNTMQDSNTTTLQSSVGNYNAYRVTTNVPFETQNYLVRDYPTAVNPTWEQAGDWYRASYLNSNRNMNVYYSPNGSGYTVALPVVQSWVPEEVITSALNTYGNSIYSVNRVRGLNGQDVYAVTVIDGGVARTEYLAADGKTMAAIDVFRNDGDMMNSTSSNAAMSNEPGTTVDNLSTESNTNATDVKTKTKITTSDGRQIKTKTKNGKTRVKESAPMNNNY
jgi:hypothetical protein